MGVIRVAVRLFAVLGFGGAVLLVGWVMLVGSMRANYVREGGKVTGPVWKL